jgi:AraC-like DNA-binding protein
LAHRLVEGIFLHPNLGLVPTEITTDGQCSDRYKNAANLGDLGGGAPPLLGTFGSDFGGFSIGNASAFLSTRSVASRSLRRISSAALRSRSLASLSASSAARCRSSFAGSIGGCGGAMGFGEITLAGLGGTACASSRSIFCRLAALVAVSAASTSMSLISSRLAKQPRNGKLAARCALLQLWAHGIAALLEKPAPHNSAIKNLRDRFSQQMEQLPEAELRSLPLAELARQIHCSERHLMRLFHEKFGVSLRSQQIELRLRHACRLLADSRIKIASIAVESGYQNLGLFNATFKKHFGMTSGEWRRNQTNLRQ